MCGGLSNRMVYDFCKFVQVKGFPGGSVGKESACSVGDPVLIPDSEIAPGEGNGDPLQHCCLENSMDRKAWQTTIHRGAKSQT